MSYSVGRVAALAGVTVRTLHHYDEIGLLGPSGRSPAGHRRYADADLDRLQRILFYRELGFPLEEVAALLDDPDVDPAEHLRRQHQVLTARIEKLQRMAEAVERAMEARKLGINLTPEEKFEVFGDKDPEQYEEEVQQRWGSTEAYRESRRRSASYTKEDWLRMKQRQDDWLARVGESMDGGAPASGEAAMDLAEEHRAMICEFYYACSHHMHTCLAEMYSSDDRFRQYYEDIKPGMAEYLVEAINANAARHS